MKRTVLSIICCLMAAVVMAQRFEYVYKGVPFKCKLMGNSVCVTGFSVKAMDVTIPDTVTYKGTDYPVKQVSTFLNGVNYLTVNLTLEDGIESLDKFCFNEFRKLQTVSLPPSIKYIGKNAFRDNSMMTLTMPSTFDENAIRQGLEHYPKAGGELIAANSHAVEADRKRAEEEAARQAKMAAKAAKAAVKDQQQQLQMQMKAEYDKLAIAKAEARKAAEDAEQARKEAERLRKNAELAAETPKPKKSVMGKLLGKVGLGKDASGSKEVATAVESRPAVEPAVPALPPVDVDMNIPVVATDKNRDMYCVIIANEKYEDVPEVEFAQRDGEVFREYCIKTLGIPEKQIKTFINASYTDIKRALNWMETMANVTDGQSKMLLYYAGHGMPDEKDKTAYLIPTDGFPKDITTCFKLSDFYGRLGKLKTQSVTVLLDACFSGVKRGSGQALVAARGIAIKPKEEVLSGNIVVFTAASDDETALAYQEKRHGMFTYFLLNKLKETKGKVSFGELFSTISSEVKKNSMLENDKLQTPSVNVSAGMKAKWKEQHF